MRAARVTGRAIVMACGCWVTATAAAGAQDMSSRAAEIAGGGGRLIGQAMACGVSHDRLQRTGTLLMERFRAAAADAEERSYALELYTRSTLMGGQLQKDGMGDPCPTVIDAFDVLERQLGPG
jgi:hypothetical protein